MKKNTITTFWSTISNEGRNHCFVHTETNELMGYISNKGESYLTKVRTGNGWSTDHYFFDFEMAKNFVKTALTKHLNKIVG